MIPRILTHFETHWAWADGLLVGALIFVGAMLATALLMGAL